MILSEKPVGFSAATCTLLDMSRMPIVAKAPASMRCCGMQGTIGVGQPW